MFFLKYILLPITGIVLAFAADDFGRMLCSRVFRGHNKAVSAVCIFLAALTVVIEAFIAWSDEKDAERDREDAQIRIDDMKLRLEESQDMLESTRTDLTKADERLVEQSRSLSSLILNAKSSEEGKMAFVTEFKKVFRALDPSNEKIMVQELLCDEGVVIYLFNRDDALTGFHLYTDADVNDALAGTRLDPLIFSKSATTVLQPEMTISKAIQKMTIEQTPKRGGNIVEREQAFGRIRAMLENICRYVYRAESFTLTIDGDGRGFLSFYYYPNPKAQKYWQGVEVKLERGEIDGLYDIQMGEFVKRTLRIFSSRGIEPKITRTEIFSVNSSALFERRKSRSPFRGVQRP